MSGAADTRWGTGRGPERWHGKEKIQGMLFKGGGCPKDREVQGSGGSGKEKDLGGEGAKGRRWSREGGLRGQEGR